VDDIVDRRLMLLRRLPFSDVLVTGLKEALAAALLREVEERRDGFVDRFRDRLDLQGMVAERLDRYDLARFESLVLRVADRELRAIVWMGALLGFLVGLAQVGVLLLLG
jgi:uncharacterized membrane protein YheB (UPF0754 family)